jgi:uncharacterized protein with PQ loop repeat
MHGGRANEGGVGGGEPVRPFELDQERRISMELHMLSGFVGTGIIIIAYIPQFVRIARTRHAADVSIPTYLLWAAGSALLLVSAMHMRSPVFTLLTLVQIVACLLIVGLALWFKKPRDKGVAR